MDIYNYNTDLCRIARYHTASEDIAKDAVQSLYLKLCEMQQKEGNLDRLFYNGKLNMVYIFTALRNIIINEYRQQKNLEPLPDRFELRPDHPEEIETGELCREVKNELAQMREYDRLMVYAYYTEGHSIRSLAKVTGISTKNIYITLRRVKDSLSETFKQNPAKFPKVCK